MYITHLKAVGMKYAVTSRGKSCTANRPQRRVKKSYQMDLDSRRCVYKSETEGDGVVRERDRYIRGFSDGVKERKLPLTYVERVLPGFNLVPVFAPQ